MNIVEILKSYDKKHKGILESKRRERTKIIKGRWCMSLLKKDKLKLNIKIN